MTQYPGDLSEQDFLETYHRSVLRKPQIVADALLKTLLHAETRDRALLTGAIAVELAEACRRLTAVYFALNDRRYSVARTLMRPLPGVEHWLQFVQKAATLAPEQLLWELSLPDSAIESAKRLRAQADLGNLVDLNAAAEGGAGMTMVPPNRSEAWFGGITLDERPVAASMLVSEGDAAALADITAEAVSIARGLLAGYLGARLAAGRRE